MIIAKIQNIGLPSKEFVVMGSAILEVKGIRKAGDLDIMVKEELFNKIKQDSSWKYTHKVHESGSTIDLLEKGDVQLYFSVYGKEDFDYFMSDASRVEEIEGIYFSSLRDLLRKKSIDWNREKDKKDVEMINTYLSTR